MLGPHENISNMTYMDLHRKLSDKPFNPFRIRLVNSTSYEVIEPWMITIGKTSAIVVTHVQKDDKGYKTAEAWRTVSIAHMLEFSDFAPEKRSRKPASFPLAPPDSVKGYSFGGSGGWSPFGVCRSSCASLIGTSTFNIEFSTRICDSVASICTIFSFG